MMKNHLQQGRRVALLLLVLTLVLLASPVFADSGPPSARTPVKALVDVNTPPTVDAGGPYTSNEGGSIILDKATAHDNDGDTLTYMWTVDQPTKCSFAPPNAIQPTLSCSDNGTYTLTLKVDDGVNGSVYDTATITVYNVAPTATFGNNGPVDEGSDFTLSLTDVVEPGVLDTYFYTFDCGDGSGYTPHSFINNFATCATSDDGTRTVRGRIQDKDDGYSVYTDTVTINNVAPTVTAGIDQTVDEGDTVNLDPATFTDPGTADTHTATIDWDDGNITDPATVTGDPGDGSVTGSHVYADNGSYTVEVCVTDDDGGKGCDTFTVTVNNVDPTATFSNTGPVDEGSDFTLSLTNPVDPGTLDTFTYAFDCGDGSGYGAFGATNTATCPTTDNGTRAVKGTIKDKDGGETEYTASVTVNNVVPTIALSGAATVNEGSTYTLNLGTITDPGTDTVEDWIVHWGDGNSNTYHSGGDVTHVYADGLTTPTITVDLKDEDGTFTSAGSKSITVNNVAPTIALSGAATVDEGSTYTLNLGTITDPGTDTVKDWIVHWGDGNSDTYHSGGDVTHVYVDGPDAPTITVDLKDEDGTFTGAGSKPITVNNVDPTVTAGNNQTVDEGDTVNLDPATFTDPGSADTHTATVNWGDGSGAHTATVSGDPGDGSVSDSHVYADNGSYPVEVCVTDKDAGNDCDTLTVTVNNVDPTVSAGNDQTVDEGDTVNLDPATFTDPGSADTHTATIDWGDGNTTDPATVIGDPGDGSVTGSHVYADNGVYPVEVCVTDDDGGSNCDTLTVTVNNVAPTVDAGPDLNGYEGIEVSLDGSTFTDPGSADTHTATIDWGDGTITDPATLTEPSSPGTVTGSHVYATQGTYTVMITVEDDDGASGADTLLINVAEVWRFRGYVYDGPPGDLSFPLFGATLQVYGLNDGDPGPATLIATTQSGYDGYFNFAIIEPWVYDTFTLMAETPAGMVPMGAWSADGTVVDAQTVQWYQPDSVVHENAFFFEVPTVAPTEAVTATISLPLLNDTWVTVGDPATMGDPNTNYDPYGVLVIRPTGLDNALMVFDRSSLPQNATILSAELAVNVVLQTGAEGKQLAAMNVETFTPALVTYTTAPAVFNPSAAVDVPIAPGSLTLDVAAQVTAWNTPGLTSYNHGYLALSASGPAGRISLDSLESSPGTPATLTVTYTIVP